MDARSLAEREREELEQMGRSWKENVISIINDPKPKTPRNL